MGYFITGFLCFIAGGMVGVCVMAMCVMSKAVDMWFIEDFTKDSEQEDLKDE